MNKDTLQGEWKQLKGKIKEKWGKLTDDEIEQIHGHKDQLLGKLQSKYGMNKEKAEEQLKEFEHKCHADCFQGHWNQIKGKLKEKWGNLTDDEITQINGKENNFLENFKQNTEFLKKKLNYKSKNSWRILIAKKLHLLDQAVLANTNNDHFKEGWQQLSLKHFYIGIPFDGRIFA